MGLFDWLRGKPDTVHIVEDCVWLTPTAKFAGIQREIAAALADANGPDAIFVVAHFEDCLAELQLLVANAGFDGSRVLVTYSKELERRTAQCVTDGTMSVFIVVGERHPLASHDDALLAFARKLSCPCRFAQHVSLEDPLLRVLSGDWVKSVLQQLGMTEDEPIESRMVSRHIRTAQQRFEYLATGDAPAQSADEWLAKNCPNVE